MSKAERPLSKAGQWLYDLCDRWGKFQVKHLWLYWILQFVWAIPTTIMGLVISLVLLICGKKPIKYYNVWIFEVGKSWGGLECGVCFLTSEGSVGVRAHEYGHIMAQTTLFGPFMIFITIASAIRYWYRELYYVRKKIYPPTAYDDIWFERSASQTGAWCVNYQESKRKFEEEKKMAATIKKEAAAAEKISSNNSGKNEGVK